MRMGGLLGTFFFFEGINIEHVVGSFHVALRRRRINTPAQLLSGLGGEA